MDFDNGTEFLNKAVIEWAGEREIFFTRSRPYKKNDQATIESKNNHLVRKYGFYYRYDTAEERHVLNRLWPLVNDRLNYLTPTIKPIGYGQHQRRPPQPPLRQARRPRWTGCWPPASSRPAQEPELIAYRDSLNPAEIARQIADLQSRTAHTRQGQDRTALPRQPSPPPCPTSAKASGSRPAEPPRFAGIPT